MQEWQLVPCCEWKKDYFAAEGPEESAVTHKEKRISSGESSSDLDSMSSTGRPFNACGFKIMNFEVVFLQAHKRSDTARARRAFSCWGLACRVEDSGFVAMVPSVLKAPKNMHILPSSSSGHNKV